MMKQWAERIANWRMQEEHKAKLQQLRADVERAFTEHPKATGETYLQHLWFTCKMSARFVYTSLVITLHGLFPFLCTRTASVQIEAIYRIMKTRIPTKRRQEIDLETKPPLRPYVATGGNARVAIIGGGFSGTLALANLVEKTQGRLTIEWFEANDALGTGVAYGTSDNAHLLNVRADRMGAFASKPEDFYQWLQTGEGKAHAAALCPDKKIAGESYVPRRLYGEYLKHIVRTALAKAKEKGVEVHIHHTSVVDASLYDTSSQQILLGFSRGSIQKENLVDAMVLATGNLPPRSFAFQSGLINAEAHYVENVWNTPKDHLYPHRVHELSPDSEIVIIGTGLTMADAVLTLRARGYKGKVTAISRSGLLPNAHVHGKAYPAWEWVYAPHFAPRTAYGLLTRLREEVQRAQKQGYDWRSVIDSLRPVTPQLWQQLDTTEKRRFLSKLFTLWNVHRHRMAPEVSAELKSMQQSGSLTVIAGKIYYVGSDKDGLTMAYRRRGANRIDTIRPTLILNCTGPEYDIATSDHELLMKLRDRGLITVGPLRAGVEITSSGAARGNASDALFPMGSLLIGEQLECTAVPELRQQAEHVALQVLHRLQLLYEENADLRHSAGEWI